MRNRIEKTNKTKFDYVCRTLGLFGVLLIIATALIGGTTLTTISNENNNLVNMINTYDDSTNKTQNIKNNEEIEEKEIKIVICE